jgi:hypothetical protein
MLYVLSSPYTGLSNKRRVGVGILMGVASGLFGFTLVALATVVAVPSALWVSLTVLSSVAYIAVTTTAVTLVFKRNVLAGRIMVITTLSLIGLMLLVFNWTRKLARGGEGCADINALLVVIIYGVDSLRAVEHTLHSAHGAGGAVLMRNGVFVPLLVLILLLLIPCAMASFVSGGRGREG